MSYQFDIEQLQDYLETLCTRHVAIQHGEGRRCFSRHRSNEHIAEIKKAAGKVCVVVADINGHRTGAKDDQMLERSITIRIAAYAEMKGDAIKAKAAAEKLAEEVLFDFMTAMEKRQDVDLSEDIYGPMHFLRLENFSWEPIEDQPWLVNHYGWDLTIPFHHYMPAYDATKWSE